MGKCQWRPPKDSSLDKFYEGCPHHCFEDHHFCIFHLPIDIKRQCPEIIATFKESLNDFFVDGIALKDDARNFQGFVFPDNMDLSVRDFRTSNERIIQRLSHPGRVKELIFQFAEFGNQTNFRYTHFGDNVVFSHVKFGDSIDFEKAIFGKNPSFSSSSFGKHTSFNLSSFGDYTYFSYSHFGEDAKFDNCHFSDVASFFATNFDKEARFSFAQFGRYTEFNSSHFGEKASFHSARFGEDTGFNTTTFHGSVDFSCISGEELALYSRPEQRKVPFEHSMVSNRKELLRKVPPNIGFYKTVFMGYANFHENDLSRVRFQQVDLTNLSFYSSKISQTKFIRCRWGSGPESRRFAQWNLPWVWSLRRPRLLLDELLCRYKIIEEKKDKLRKKLNHCLDPQIWLWNRIRIARWQDNHDPKIVQLGQYSEIKPADIEVLALQLKQSLEATKDPIAAGDFHFAVMEMKRMQAMEAKRWGRAFMLWLYKTINGYGERYGRTALWLLFLLLISSGVFASFKVPGIIDGVSYWERLDPAAFYSLQHVLPFKLGTSVGVVHKANSLLGWLTVIETIIGTTLFTFFALALRRRFKR
jgi:uncharacterized protein YjbI with pentapeptide repeats